MGGEKSVMTCMGAAVSLRRTATAIFLKPKGGRWFFAQRLTSRHAAKSSARLLVPSKAKAKAPSELAEVGRAATRSARQACGVLGARGRGGDANRNVGPLSHGHRHPPHHKIMDTPGLAAPADQAEPPKQPQLPPAALTLAAFVGGGLVLLGPAQGGGRGCAASPRVVRSFGKSGEGVT